MSSSLGSFDLSGALAERGVGLESLGAAYLVLIATVVLTGVAFHTARSLLVVSPNRGARDYGIYVSVALATLALAIVLENEILPSGGATLHYVALPQLVALLGLHLAVSYRPEPWVVTLGGAATATTVAIGVLLGLTTELVGLAYWIALFLLAALLAFLWVRAVSTKRAFVNARSIYLSSKEAPAQMRAPQKPWPGLAQCVALVAASLGLGLANSLLRGRAIEEIPVVEVVLESSLLLVVTAVVCAVPSASYWLARKAWMPELTRFVWLAWIVVGFALTYGNYLNRLARV
jgi:hypothetical protein